MKRSSCAVFLLFLSVQGLVAQISDLQIWGNNRRVEIPFEYQNHFIIVSVLFNNLFPLKFIFDTGAEHTVLTKREITDLLGLPFEKRFTLMGSDMQQELFAYLVRGINLRINEVSFTNRSILVLEDDYFQFEQFTGVNVAGIIGADLFRRFVVEINYRTQRIILHDPNYFRPPRHNTIEPRMELKRHKPYLYTRTYFSKDTIIETKLLLDTGASLALLLYTDTHPDLHLPPQVIRSQIGRGLGGFLEGFLGRIDRLDIGPVPISGIVTNFQELYPVVDTSYTNDRNGILGNQILDRFIVTIDYIHNKLYLQPQRKVREAFRFDRSGLAFAASGPRLNVFTVYQVLPGSPAAEAGIQRGDVLKTINGLPTTFISLNDLSKKLQKRVGKNIRMTLEREDQKIKISFQLRELI